MWNVLYNGTDAITTNTQHEYNNSTYLQLSKMRVKEAKSDGFIKQADARQIETEYKYPYDFTFIFIDATYINMVSKTLLFPSSKKRLV